MIAQTKQEILKLANQYMQDKISSEELFQHTTQLIATGIDCSRASIWRYTSGLANEVECLDLYDQGEKNHFSGFKLHEDDFHPYFDAMHRDNMIVASDARYHPATSCFNALYFEPNGIYSLLDVGIHIHGTPFGLFCCENVTFVKEWNQEHIDFLRSAGTLMGMALRKAVS